MSARWVVRQALQVVQNGTTEGDGDGEVDGENEEGRWGSVNEFNLCVRTGRDAPPMPLRGIERSHAIQMSRIRQTLSNEDGFDLEHVNAKNNPCGLVFELRKKNQGIKKFVTSRKGDSGTFVAIEITESALHHTFYFVCLLQAIPEKSKSCHVRA
ncbi:hypothetical protein K1T71_009764 [Dendrolimus kikuchii]|uniref:Uncharacterized protein n=1 Tax=Dendrolimus kikuchii TaxID=765133 RepID=A0ACC1CSS8_9NEOP|nr:hypothetical protein K1T71_009764 [Dendrolimus kikuchii]